MSLVASLQFMFTFSISSLGKKIFTHLIIFPFNSNYIQLNFCLTFAEWFVHVTQPHIHAFLASVICPSSESSDHEDAERKGHFLNPKNISDLLSEISIRVPAESSWAVKDVITIIGWNCAQIGYNQHHSRESPYHFDICAICSIIFLIFLYWDHTSKNST